MTESLLAFKMRPSRRKAVDVAASEVATLLGQGCSDLSSRVSRQGPEIVLALTGAPTTSQIEQLSTWPLGYSTSWTYYRRLEDPASKSWDYKWHGCKYRRAGSGESDASRVACLRPENRTFEVDRRMVVGYRGGYDLSGRFWARSLAPEDAFVLVNLSSPSMNRGLTLLDPFAGSGTIVLAAEAAGMATMSGDFDPIIGHGLAQSTSIGHCQSDATQLPYADGSVDGVATEPPFDLDNRVLALACSEILRVTKPGAHVSVCCAIPQRDVVVDALSRGGRIPGVWQFDRRGMPNALVRICRGG